MAEAEVEEMIMIAMMTAAARTIAEVRETATTIAMAIDAHRRVADVMTTMMMRSRDMEDAVAAVEGAADGAEDEVIMAAA